MAAEYRDAAEPCFLNAQALMPSDRRWPYYLAHLYRLRNEPAKSAAFFEKALQLRPDDVAALVWLGGVYLLQGRPEPAEPLFTKALSLQPRLAAALFGLGRAGAGEKGVCRRREVSGRGARAGSARLDHPLSARDGLPRARRAGKGRDSPATAGPGRSCAARSVDVGIEWIAAQRAGLRAAGGQGARQERVGGGRGVFSQGSRAGAGQRVRAAQARNRVVPERRCARRHGAIRRSGAAIAGFCEGALQPRRAHDDERPGERSDRAALGCREVRPELRRGAPETGRGSATKRTRWKSRCLSTSR